MQSPKDEWTKIKTRNTNIVIKLEGRYFKDEIGHTLVLRGVNLLANTSARLYTPRP